MPCSSSKFLPFSVNDEFSLQEHRPQLRYNSPLHPRITSCHGKLNGSSEGDPGEIDEALFYGYDGIEDEKDDDDAESSVDELISSSRACLIRFPIGLRRPLALFYLQSYRLSLFLYDGALLLAFLSIAKALFEVVCNLGGAVFLAILLLRIIWAAVSYFQSSSNSNRFNQGGSSFSAAA